MPTRTPNPHDRFFKASWSRPEVASGFLAHYLPADVRSVLDLNTLTLSKDSFIDATLKAHYSDLLYQVKRTQGEDAYVYILMEHKSYPDRWTVFQLLRYIIRIPAGCRAVTEVHSLSGVCRTFAGDRGVLPGGA